MSLPDNMLDMDRETFDAYMLTKAQVYSVCVFLGMGRYQTEYFYVKGRKDVTRRLAELYRDKILRDCPNLGVKPMIYGIVLGSYGPQLSIFVE